MSVFSESNKRYALFSRLNKFIWNNMFVFNDKAWLFYRLCLTDMKHNTFLYKSNRKNACTSLFVHHLSSQWQWYPSKSAGWNLINSYSWPKRMEVEAFGKAVLGTPKINRVWKRTASDLNVQFEWFLELARLSFSTIYQLNYWNWTFHLFLNLIINLAGHHWIHLMMSEQ